MNNTISSTAPQKSPSPLADALSRLVAFSLPVTYFLVTVSFYLRTYDSAQIKITLTQIGCTLVILFWLAQLVVEKRWPFQKSDLVLVAPFVAVFASGVISFLQSSFLTGSVDEFVRRVLYSFMGVIVIVEFRGVDRHRRLFRWLLAAFGIAVFYGFVQFFDTRLFPPGQGVGLDPFVWRHAFGNRPFSTFGNPNFYGNFLVIITPIILAIYLRSGGRIFRPYLLTALAVVVAYFADKLFIGKFGGVDAASRLQVEIGLVLSVLACLGVVWWKTPSAAASGMLLFWGAMFINLYSTETKGAWLGFVGALALTTLLVGVFFTGGLRKAIGRRLVAVVAVTILLGVGIVGYYAHLRFQSVSFRVFTWIGTWEMIREQPFFGTGIGSFKWAYPAHRRPEIILVEAKSNTETDHSEDEYLEIWYDEGAFGFGVFLWLVLMVSWLGLRALKNLTQTAASRAPPGETPHFGYRAYSLLAYLGAYWGALIHWFVDVSVRFVSSGVYSLLLPGLVVSLIRNEKMEVRQDAPSPLDRWVRASLVIFWFVVLLSLNMALPGVFICCFIVWALGELLEIRLTPEYAPPAPLEEAEETPASSRSWGVGPAQALALLLLLGAWGYTFRDFRDIFFADINHNIAIFFSKQGVWTKSHEFDSKVDSFPPEMREEYKNVGGALEHYQKVVRLNPFFPMARYFIGNVYNDWGSRYYNQSIQNKQGGDEALALSFKKKAEDTWRLGIEAYDRVKAFAPNYVQTHHQVGLIYLKMGDMEQAWGNHEKKNEYWDLALENFALYHQLDPVFPQNYYRQAYIHFSRGDIAKAEEVYLGALDYNTNNVVNRIYHHRNAETCLNLARLFYIQLVNKHAPNGTILPSNVEDFKKAESYYLQAVEHAEKITDKRLRPQWLFDSIKGTAILYSRANVRDKALQYWQRARALRPDDPDVQNVFRPAAS